MSDTNALPSKARSRLIASDSGMTESPGPALVAGCPTLREGDYPTLSSALHRGLWQHDDHDVGWRGRRGVALFASSGWDWDGTGFSTRPI